MKSLKTCLVVFLIMGVAVAAGLPSVHAQMMQCRDRFKSLDVNGDGKVTEEEFKAFDHPGMKADEVFAATDKNNDGVLTEEEFCAFRGHGKGKGKMQL
jgi:hypothetical protein